MREKSTFVILVLVYLFCSIRYFPGQIVKTVIETMLHIVSVAPYSIGITIIAVAVFRKLVSERLPWDRVLRIFLTAAIVGEFFFGLYNYLGKGQ